MAKNGAKIDTNQIREVVALYLLGTDTQKSLSNQYGISMTTLGRYIKRYRNDEEVVKIVESKKKESTEKVQEKLSTYSKDLLSGIELGLEAVKQKDKWDAATINQCSTTLGTLIDKLMIITDRFNNTETDNSFKIVIEDTTGNLKDGK